MDVERKQVSWDSQAIVIDRRFEHVLVLLDPFRKIDWWHHHVCRSGARYYRVWSGQSDRDARELKSSSLPLQHYSKVHLGPGQMSSNGYHLNTALPSVRYVPQLPSLDDARIRVALDAVKLELQDVRQTLNDTQSITNDVKSLQSALTDVQANRQSGERSSDLI
jgi:hypothetical protein